jgi:lipoprotein-anchoring transpeptidase ErfK/SrfK
VRHVIDKEQGASVSNHQRIHTGRYAGFNIREGVLTMTASIALLAGASSSAKAFPFNNWQPAAAPQQWSRPGVVPRAAKPPRRGNATSRQKSTPKDKGEEAAKADVAAKAKGVLTVAISLNKQRLTLYSDGQPVAHSRVSTGTASHPTPTGVFSIIQKNRWHRSNIYDNAPMFYMQRITWSGVAMHQGIVPNQPASHGCIRLPEAFARQLWGTTKLGARVVVTRGEVAPVAFAHKRLFTVKREPLVPNGEPGAAEMVKSAHGALEVAQLGAAKPGATTSDAAKPADPALDAMAYAGRSQQETPASSSEMVKSAYDVFEAPKVRRARMSAPVAATTVAEVPALKPGPISVFISRKEGKLFVRKGFEPVFSVPVTFEQPERPLGTHVFTALALKEDNTTLRWHVVSLSSGGHVRRTAKGAKVMEPVLPASNPGQALDRVTIPPEALDKISELMSPGASLIISDQGLGPETGRGTDFIVLTR